MKTFKEFNVSKIHIPEENSEILIRLVDGNYSDTSENYWDASTLLIEVDEKYECLCKQVNKEQHFCWLVIDQLNWAWPVRFDNFRTNDYDPSRYSEDQLPEYHVDSEQFLWGIEKYWDEYNKINKETN